jgi:sulfur-carrier protein
MRGGCAGNAEQHNASKLLYPGLGHHLEEETTVAIDGQIHKTAYFQPIRPGCEIFFISKLEGG